MSPYATGGGGVTFERKVAVYYLARMLTGLGCTELGDGRMVARVAFQQAPEHSVDDLVIHAKRSDENDPSLVFALTVRRAPNIVKSDAKAQKLIGSLLAELDSGVGENVEHRVGLVVAGYQNHAAQLATLADLARGQSDPAAFGALVDEPERFDRSIRDRLDHVRALVKAAIQDPDGVVPDDSTVAERTWLLLSQLEVLMPRFESPDDSDWASVANDLITDSRTGDLAGAIALRDRMAVLAAAYAPIAADIDLDLLRRAAHYQIASSTRRHQDAWQVLGGLQYRAAAAVRSRVTSSDGNNELHINRSAIVSGYREFAAANPVVIVHGESGVGKSALVVEAALTDNESDDAQALVVNLRHLPVTVLELEQALGLPLAAVLAEMSAPDRLLVVDAADAVAEGKSEHLRYLVDSARHSSVRVVALTTNDVRKLVHDEVAARCTDKVMDYEIPALIDSEIDELAATFPELAALAADVHARELLRRLVVVDLLIRGGVSGIPVTDGDAMEQVWAGLVRRHEQTDRGAPDARDTAMLRLADLAITGSDPLPVVGTLDGNALTGLRRDGLLQTAASQRFKIGPEFAHDEVRRYAVARLVLADDDPTVRLLAAGMPRWSLGAARLASQLYLAAPDTPDNPSRGRFARLQKSFDRVVAADHGERWSDVPGEALLSLPDAGATLADAWVELCAHNKAGLHRLCRLLDQRFRDANHLVHLPAVEPLIAQLLSDAVQWLGDKKLQVLVRDWLRSLIAANAAEGNELRVYLRTQLVARCGAADERQQKEREAAEARLAARTPEEVKRDRERSTRSAMFGEIGYPQSRRRRRRELPREITDEVVVELLALLGPDLGDEGEQILRRIATDEPARLRPAVEGVFAGRASAARQRGFLADITEAYYLDDEEDGSGFHEDGIRDHEYHGLGVPFAAWYYGPFSVLLQTDFRGGVRAINKLLNHAALVRARTLAGLGDNGRAPADKELDNYSTELKITGVAGIYLGDAHVWAWYRGTSVGPYPCMSALQALERVCDQFIEAGAEIGTLIAILLDECENLAMVGFVVGLLVRHLEKSDRLLDPYLSEPLIWHLEFGRVASDASGLAASSEGVVGGERRRWSLREAAMMLVLRADEERADDLRRLGEVLVERAEQEIRAAVGAGDEVTIERELVSVRGWASGMDRSTYSAELTEDGQLMIQSTPSRALLDALDAGSVDIRRVQEATRLSVAYYINLKKGAAEPWTADVLVADLAAAKQLLDDTPVLGAGGQWDAPAAVAAVALEAHLIDGVVLPEDSLLFAAETIVSIAELEDQGRRFESEEAYFEQGADRVAARVLPLLMTPAADRVRALMDADDGSRAFAEVVAGAKALAAALPNEVRVHLARGLDHVWQAPCSDSALCHHEAAFDIVLESMRDAGFGPWDPETGRRAPVRLADPIAEPLRGLADDAIYFHRLDAALRALAPASVASICVSDRAKELFAVVLSTQRRALLSDERDMDDRGTHALVAARALLAIIEGGDDAELFNHLDAFADRSDLLGAFIRAVSAAGEESTARAAVAARIWPDLVKRVLSYQDDHQPFDGGHSGDYTRAALIPNLAGEVAYLYPELTATPIVWWDPNALSATVREWLPGARGDATCVDHLISFIYALGSEDQVLVGLPWVADLVRDSAEDIAHRSFLLSSWLIEIRPAVIDKTALATWQQLVDALVVAGDSKLAPYSL
ncbi:ATP-binding protein [Antrihabitans cavernicola]|uniref:ATP-binding protein n=1 Tax=Antrihabitans cavernicola TaxID=2495913 RepID=A0A5A7SHW3_9NOCA|nr:ATP-binding protein [Spelaeibacter cavernicola]KAA0024085.1 ATP-binding protein [Spelaeibacter cavernicola]